MSLSYDLKNIADHKSLINHPVDADRIHPILEKLIFCTMSCEIGTITADNAEEFFWRLAFVRRLDRQPDAAFMDGQEVFITLEDVKQHIGLHTNVTTVKSRKTWLGRFIAERAYGVRQEGTGREVFDRIARENAAKAKAKQHA